MTLPEIRVVQAESGAASAVLVWDAVDDVDTLLAALSAVADDLLGAGGLRRLEVALPSKDLQARRAVLRSGFRVEGVRRSAVVADDGSVSDLVLYARLAVDPVGGAHGFSAVMNSALPRKRLIAHVLIRSGERLVLCETRFKPDWELPGGIVEPLEPPRVAAAREVREELGIDLSLGRLLVTDWMPPYLGWDDAVEMIFDGGEVTEPDLERFVLQPTEIARVELVTLDQAAGLVIPVSHRRLTIAMSLRPGESAYLEDGYLVSGRDQR